MASKWIVKCPACGAKNGAKRPDHNRPGENWTLCCQCGRRIKTTEGYHLNIPPAQRDKQEMDLLSIGE